LPSPLHLHPGECVPRGVFAAPRDGRLREFPRLFLSACILLCLVCTSCGAVGSGPPPPVTVTVMPNSAQPFTGGNVQFRAVVENASSPAVNWLVNQMPSGNAAVGIITSNGFYTAPNSPATVTVTAVLQTDPTKTGSAIVTVQSLSSIQGPLTLSPKLSSVTTSQTLQLNVLTAGVSKSDVSWSVACVPVGGCSPGTITPSGLFTPPNTASSNLVTASLIANPSAIGSATVEVTDFPGMLTWRNDNSRSGVNSQELALTPGTVSPSTFGELFSCPIDGNAYAQPLYVPNLPIPGKGMHNVIFVATEKDSVYAFDADLSPCLQLWQTSLIPVGSQPIATPPVNVKSFVIVPSVGITGTPAIDVNASALYVVAAIETLGAASPYSHRLYALDLATGRQEIKPAGAAIATPTSVFPSRVENQRAALLLDNGTVYIAFGSYGGLDDYQGWLFGYDSSSLQQTGVFNAAPNPTSGGGIWQSGGGPSVDSNHNIFVATGDGPPNFVTNYIDSIVRLGTNGGLSVADYFAPCDRGLDWGVNPNAVLQSESSAPVLLPDSAGSAAQPHLLIGGSKEGFLYVVNRDFMGEFPSPCSDSAPRVQAIQTGGEILSTPLFWNDYVYVAPGNANLMSFHMSGGILAPPPPVSQSPETLGPQGATAVISSNGTNNAILWLIDSSGALAMPTNTPAILRAYDPNDLSKEIYNSAMAAASRDTAGLAVKFTVPTVANGKVYIGTQTELDVYGLLQ
jgi:hypothetical protein